MITQKEKTMFWLHPNNTGFDARYSSIASIIGTDKAHKGHRLYNAGHLQGEYMLNEELAKFLKLDQYINNNEKYTLINFFAYIRYLINKHMPGNYWPEPPLPSLN